MGKNRITFNEFKSRCDKTFGKGAFLFDEKDYVNTITKMNFVCSKCGEVINDTPAQFLRRSGCPSCRPKTYTRGSVENLIERFRAMHGDRYDYSLITEYKGVDPAYDIICRKHGIFPQSAYAHMHGQGCPRCYAERHKAPIFGVGINDSDERIKIKDKLIPSYDAWTQMLKRCYEEHSLKRRPTYVGCSVCDEWLHFSNFKKWFDDPANGYREGYQLEKDLLVDGNKVYSPETCCFVPNLINSQIKRYETRPNGFPVGVYQKKDSPNKYYSTLTFDDKTTFLGSFDTIEEAHNAYKTAKENAIHNIAKELFSKGEITERVYNALVKYKIRT